MNLTREHYQRIEQGRQQARLPLTARVIQTTGIVYGAAVVGVVLVGLLWLGWLVAGLVARWAGW